MKMWGTKDVKLHENWENKEWMVNHQKWIGKAICWGFHIHIDGIELDGLGRLFFADSMRWYKMIGAAGLEEGKYRNK